MKNNKYLRFPLLQTPLLKEGQNSFKFIVIGDYGMKNDAQLYVADRMKYSKKKQQR